MKHSHFLLGSHWSPLHSSYRLSLAIDRASRLYGGSIKCGEYMGEKVAAVCPVAECKTIEESMTLYCVSHTSVVPGSPLNLHQISSANTESSVVVQWKSPLETGASGVYISEYTVTVDGNSTESVTDDGRDMFTHTISGLDYNTSYDVEVTAINSCDIQSQPATTRATTRTIKFVLSHTFSPAPPQPTLLSPVLTCDTLQPETGRTVIFTWEVSLEFHL